MQRPARVTQLWNWLPAFRAVAETQHLPSASTAAHLSPSALSRSVKQLEDELGVELFKRVGRALVLSPAGEDLLRAVREAMLRVEEGVRLATDDCYSGTLRVSAPSPLMATFVLPALNRVREQHPRLVPDLIELDSEATREALLSGSLDLAILDATEHEPGLHVTCLGVITRGVYCGEAHPLYSDLEPTLEKLVEYGFVAPSNPSEEHWPQHHQRHIAMRTQRVDLALRICADGELLSLLPDLVAQVYSGPGSLHRIPLELCEPTPLYAVQRASSSELARQRTRSEPPSSTRPSVPRPTPRKQEPTPERGAVSVVLGAIRQEFARAARRSNPYINLAGQPGLERLSGC
ncbi:MAG: LysR family transcriptional regulator [Myxococcales bacterium]|nr:LysR family transcriptional regulator [Myxococcales bacterium]